MSIFYDKMIWYRLLTVLLDWLGTPYAHFKMDKKRGADCALFIAACLKEIGILKNIAYKYYPRFWHKFTETEVILNHITGSINENIKKGYRLVNVNKNNLTKGDIIIFSIRSKVSNHVALYLGNNLITHSINGRGVCIVPLSNEYKNRITNNFRIVRV